MSTLRQPNLFDAKAANKRENAHPAPTDPRFGARLRMPVRTERELIGRSLDDLLSQNHRARLVWRMVERFDLSPLYRDIAARHNNAGAPAIDPRITLTLWIYATMQGVGSSHQLARLCTSADAYKWICGGVSVSQRHLSSFRADNGDLFHDLFTNIVATLLKHNLCKLHRVAQDGTRVRVDVGAASFRREQSLDELKKTAGDHLAAVNEESSDAVISSVRKAAIKRGAKDRLNRINEALDSISKIPSKSSESDEDDKKRSPRASTTNAETKIIKMGDGGFRPAVNMQFATTTDEARVIVAVTVTSSGSDAHQAVPMMEVIKDTYGTEPKELLVDGGYANAETIDALAPTTKVYAPLRKAAKGQRPSEEPRETDSPAMAEWRKRMQTDEAKLIYRERAATAETVHADGKAHRTLARVPLRGLIKAFACASLFALTYNIMRVQSLLR